MERVNEIARVLGIGLLASVAARLPARVAAAVQMILIVAGSLLPLVPLWRGSIGLPDLLAYSTLWLAISVVTTLIRLQTIRAHADQARFWMLHYSIMIGVLSLVCGAWAVILLSMAGVRGGWITLLPMAIAIVLANAWALADGWFVRRGQEVAQLWQVLLPGYLRFVPVLGATIAGAVLIMGDGPSDLRQIVAVALVLAMAAIDIILAVLSLRRTAGAGELSTRPQDDAVADWPDTSMPPGASPLPGGVSSRRDFRFGPLRHGGQGAR